jgi:hypothetical protein
MMLSGIVTTLIPALCPDDRGCPVNLSDVLGETNPEASTVLESDLTLS